MGKINQALIVIIILAFAKDTYAECSDRNSIAAAMSASDSVLGGESYKSPVILKRHHPSKRKEVATYYKRSDLYYTLYFLVGNDCQAQFIKRSRGKY